MADVAAWPRLATSCCGSQRRPWAYDGNAWRAASDFSACRCHRHRRGILCRVRSCLRTQRPEASVLPRSARGPRRQRLAEQSGALRRLSPGRRHTDQEATSLRRACRHRDSSGDLPSTRPGQIARGGVPNAGGPSRADRMAGWRPALPRPRRRRLANGRFDRRGRLASLAAADRMGNGRPGRR